MSTRLRCHKFPISKLALGLVLVFFTSSCLSEYEQSVKVYLCNETDNPMSVSFLVPQNIHTAWWIGGERIGYYSIGTFVSKVNILETGSYSPPNSYYRELYPNNQGPIVFYLKGTIDTIFRNDRRERDTAYVEKTDSLWGIHPATPRFTTLYDSVNSHKKFLTVAPFSNQIVDWEKDTTGYVRITIPLMPRDTFLIAERLFGRRVSDPVQLYARDFMHKSLEAKWRTASGILKNKHFDTKYLFSKASEHIPKSVSEESSYDVINYIVCK